MAYSSINIRPGAIHLNGNTLKPESKYCRYDTQYKYREYPKEPETVMFYDDQGKPTEKFEIEWIASGIQLIGPA